MTHDKLLALTGDQIKYFEFSLKWPDLLKQQIPFGFPLFLRLVGLFDPSYRLLPWLTLSLWVASLGFLWWALREAGWKTAMILGIVAPLAVSISMRPCAWHGNPYFYANTERLTAILSAVLFGCVVMEKDWAASIVTFAMCLVRPAMLFVPVVVFFMRPSFKRAIILFVPFALFMGLRWIVVGDDAFCSYGAMQATRIYAPLVVPADIERVPHGTGYQWLYREILKVPKGPTDTVLDREAERDLYTKWMMGDKYHAVVDQFVRENFSNDVEGNIFLRGAWSYIADFHAKERVLLYFRALRVALTKIQDPVVVCGLMGILWWMTAIKHMEIRYGGYLLFIMLRWFGLWTFFSITTLLLVQFPDDRYMQICYLWLPSMLGCAIGFIW